MLQKLWCTEQYGNDDRRSTYRYFGEMQRMHNASRRKRCIYPHPGTALHPLETKDGTSAERGDNAIKHKLSTAQ